jgi:Flp pilus assembly protein TadG
MKRPTRTRGQALAEFALVFPLFILLLLAVFDIGRAVFAYNGITNAAREGARLAIVNQTTASITTRATDQAPGAPVTVCVVLLAPGQTTNDCASTPAGSRCAVPPLIGCVASVEVATQYRAITPVIGNLIGPMTLTARTEIPIEFVCPNISIPAWSTSGSCPKQP